jgi:hypothetical protein
MSKRARFATLPRVLATRVTPAEDALIRTAAEAASVKERRRVTVSAFIRRLVVTDVAEGLRDAVQVRESVETSP